MSQKPSDKTEEPIDRELLKGSMATLVLSTLARREMYGYELSRELETSAEGKLQVKEGTLYPVLHQLEKLGQIKARWEDAPDTGRRRKYYAITAKGRTALADKRTEWKSFRALIDGFLTPRGAAETSA